MRKAIAAAVALACCALLTACVGTGGSGTKSSGSGAGSSGSAAVGAPPANTAATINIWSYIDPKDSPWIGRTISHFKTEYPNVKVKWTYIPYANLTAKILGTAAAGGTPDGIFYNPADSAQLDESGLLADMAPYWNSFADRSAFPSSVVWTSNGKLLSLQGYVNTTALYYNKTLLDQLKLKPPTTVAELGQDLQAVHAAGHGGLTLCAAPTAESEFQFFPWLLGNGQNYGKWNASAVGQTFAQFDDWVKAGYIPRDVAGWTQADAWTKFGTGDYAFSQNGNWNLSTAKTTLKFQWGVVPIPAGTAGSHSVGGGEGFSISAKTKNAALTWQFFQEGLLTKSAELGILKDSGSIPSRSDLASDPAIASDPNLTVFAQVVRAQGVRPNTPKMGQYLVDMGKIWNAVVGGQTSPQQAAQQVVQQLSVA